MMPGQMGFRGPMGMMGGMGMPNPGEALVSGAQQGFGFAQEVMDAPIRRQMLQNQADEQQRRSQWELQDRDFTTSGRALDAAEANENNLIEQNRQFYQSLPRDANGQIDTTKLTPDQQNQMTAASQAAEQAHAAKRAAFHSHYAQDFVDLNSNIKKTATKMQMGQDVPPEEAYVMLGAATGGNLGAYVRNPGAAAAAGGPSQIGLGSAVPAAGAPNAAQEAMSTGKSQIEQGIDLVQHGIGNKDQGALLQGANILMKPMLDRGIGQRQPNGITTQKQELIGFVPGKGGGDSMLPIVKITGTTDDGRTVSYTAGVPNDNDHGPDGQYVPHSMHEWMDYMQRQRQMVDIVNHPEIQQALQQGAANKQAQATLADWKHSYDVFGKGGIDKLPKGKYQLKNTDLGDSDQQDVFDEEHGQVVSSQVTPKGTTPNVEEELAQKSEEGAATRASQEKRTAMIAGSRVAAAGARGSQSQFAQKRAAIQGMVDDGTIDQDEAARLEEALIAPAAVKGGGGVSEKEIGEHVEGMLTTLMASKGFTRDKQSGDWVGKSGIRLDDSQVRSLSDVSQALAGERQRLMAASKTERAVAANAPKKKAVPQTPAPRAAIVGS